MIKFTTLKFRNFLNSGNQETTYDFKPGLTRLEGVSGVGKSTVIDAFYFALTGEPFRDDVKINELVNWINESNLKVELSFTKGDDVFTVTRTLKDEHEDIFYIHKNQELIPIDKKKKTYQEQLYDILGIDKHYIEIGLIKSNLRDISFLSMKKADRVAFGEKFFKLDVVTQIESSLKTDLDSNKVSLNQVTNSVTETTQFKTTLETKINQMKKLLEESNRQQIDEKEARLAQIKTEIETNTKASEVIGKLTRINVELESAYNQLISEESEISEKIRIIKSDENLRRNKSKLFIDNCPTCVTHPKIFGDDSLNELAEERKKLEESLEPFGSKKESLRQKIQKNREGIAKKATVESNLRRLNAETIENTAAIEKLSKKAPEIDYSELNALTKNLEELQTQLESLTSKSKVLGDLKKLMTPLKIFLIKRRLMFMNVKLNEYLRRFNLPFNLIFNESFEPKIYSGKKTKNYHLLSVGERRRIDLALTFTFIDLALELSRERYNVFIADEIFDNIDVVNIDLVMEILREKISDDSTEVIFVSHNGNFNGHKVDRRVLVTNENGFGQLSEL